jgi:hypothetical protein
MDKLNEKDIEWTLEEPERDDSFTFLEVGETLSGRLVSKNKNWYNNYVYIIQKLDDDIVKINGSTNLDKWMEKFEPGDLLQIKRIENLKSPNPERNDLKRFEVYKGSVKK